MLKLNGSYGHRQILLAYVGASERPVHAFIQHGWTQRPDAGSGWWANSGHFTSAPRLYWSRRQSSEAAQAGVPNTNAIGAPFIYLCALLGLPIDPPSAVKSARDDRLLIYPQHNSEFHRSARHDFPEDYREHVASLIRDGVQVTVALHPVDWRDGSVRGRYESMGWRVARHGAGLYDPHFLVRQYIMLREHQSVWSHGLGSAAIYAAHMGVQVKFVSRHPFSGWVLTDWPSERDFEVRQDLYTYMRSFSSFGSFAAAEVGADLLVGRDELRELLGISGSRLIAAHLLRRLGRVQAGLRFRLLGDVTARG